MNNEAELRELSKSLTTASLASGPFIRSEVIVRSFPRLHYGMDRLTKNGAIWQSPAVSSDMDLVNGRSCIVLVSVQSMRSSYLSHMKKMRVLIFKVEPWL